MNGTLIQIYSFVVKTISTHEHDWIIRKNAYNREHKLEDILCGIALFRELLKLKLNDWLNGMRIFGQVSVFLKCWLQAK